MDFRRVEREDTYEPYSQLWTSEYPDMRKTPNQVQHEFLQMSAGAFEEHWMSGPLNEPEAMLTVGDWYGGGVDRVLNADILVNPPSNTSAYMQALDFAEEIGKRVNTQSLSVWVCNRALDRVSILNRRSYKNSQTVPVTRLSLPQFVLEEIPFPNGIRFGTIAELHDKGIEWIPQLYEATWELAQDMPNPHPPTRMPFEEYQKVVMEEAVFRRDLMFIALDGDRIVAYSRVTPSEAMPELALTGMSGTVRSHRRKGIIRALKIRAIRHLRDLGYLWLQTDNDETNPMFQLNLELGFETLFSWHYFERAP